MKSHLNRCEESSEESNGESNADPVFEELPGFSCTDEVSNTEVDFDEIYEEINQLQTFEQLEEYVEN